MSDLICVYLETNKKEIEEISKNKIEQDNFDSIDFAFNVPILTYQKINSNENANNFDNMFDLNLKNFLDNLTNDNKNNKNKSTIFK